MGPASGGDGIGGVEFEGCIYIQFHIASDALKEQEIKFIRQNGMCSKYHHLCNVLVLGTIIERNVCDIIEMMKSTPARKVAEAE
jgi:ACT domain-containing protein